MAYNTRKHDAKKRIKKADEDRRDNSGTWPSELLARASKSAKPRVEIDPEHPRAAVVMLTNYLTRLEVLRDDLEAEFGNLQEFASGASWLSTEIRLSIEALVKLRIRVEAGS